MGCRRLLAVGLLLWAGSAVAQLHYENVEPRWLRLDIVEWSAGMEAEGLTENVRVNGSSSTHDQLSLTPLVGLRTQGSIYHPSFMTYNCNAEGGYGWMNDSVTGPGTSSSRHENGDVLRYLVQLNFLSGKPYNVNLTAAQDHTYRNYDAFSTYTVDTTRFSGHAGWHTETLTLDADAGWRKEDSTGINGSSQFTETYFNFSGMQMRESGQTTLTSRYSEFDTITGSNPSQTTTTASVGASDSETFGSRKQISTVTGASFSQSEYSGETVDTFIVNENLSVKHRPDLETYLNANFSHSTLNAFVSSYLQGEAGVRHQLYESLTSTLDVHGSYDESSGMGVSASNSRYGVGLHENYSKRLGDWGRFSLGGGIAADHENHESSGAVLTTIDEAHRLYLPTDPKYRPVYLNNPQVIAATIQVRGPRGYGQQNVDYIVIPTGLLTEIQLVQTNSTVLQNGDEVFVTYQSESLYTASFESLIGSAQIRLDIFDRYGIYGRLNWLDNNAPPQALTQTLLDLVGGVDYSWKGLRAGAEYEDYDSNFIQYRAWRFFQGFNYQTAEGSTYGLDFTQNFYRYPDDFTQDSYRFTGRYHTLLSSSLTCYVEGGYALQNVQNTQQDFAFARTGLSWTRGKLSLRGGYEYNYQETRTGPTTELRNRNYFFAYLKRTF